MKEFSSKANRQYMDMNSGHNTTHLAPLSEAKKLSPSELYHPCDLELFEFSTTDDIEPISSPLGFDRAVNAIKLGMGIPSKGFNIYVMGSAGLGKHSITQRLLTDHIDKTKPISDWCYVNNFHESNKPLALQLPAGMGKHLKHKIQLLIDELKVTVPSSLQSENLIRETDQLQSELNEKEISAFQSIETKAEKKSCVLKRSRNGYLIHPIRNDKVLSKEEFSKLSLKEQKTINDDIEELRLMVVNLLKQVPIWDQEMRTKKEKLERECVGMTLDYLAGQLPEELLEIEAVHKYIQALKQHVLDNISLFSGSLETEVNEYTGQKLSFSPFTVYDVNVIVDNSKTESTPVIYEDNPTYVNLFGRVEHRGEFGAFVTNFTLIKPGAFHRANGGYLLLDVNQLLNKPFVWDVFKRTLLSRELRIQPLEQLLSINAIASLEPEVIPIDIKIILFGNRMFYYLLKQYDPDFGQLFKVQADCAEEIDRTPEVCQLYAKFIKHLQAESQTRPLSREAVARVIEFAARQVEDGEKMTLHQGDINSLILESNYWAEQHKQDVISLENIQQAIDEKEYRTGYIKELITENIHRGISTIETEGMKVGQVNGLSVYRIDDSMFGRPTRITAAVHLGQGNVINIEREVSLSGPSHSKGVMILTAFMRQQYEQREPLSFSATLTFEQSHGMVDGDSASTAELCALISAIAEVPLKQSIALTGAIDQHGNIEAIGGVNEKIEGFFDICNTRGLNGEHGVIIPKTNIAHLMINENVRQAVERGQFHIWAVDHLDQVMALLTDKEMGKPDAKQKYPANSINAAVLARIKRMNKAKNKSSEDTKRSKQQKE
ncbi:Lon protease family protein [uncultured Photobacterium sp.]|uniref:Lon protease family protein n=1 Tax=uncultured Photobacterium sp. TaxID=173973 RepID=UPI002625C8C2|nr:ATP-binding protein [uncultured Photobacterium sp.]